MKIDYHSVCLVCTSVTDALVYKMLVNCLQFIAHTIFTADFNVTVTFLELCREEKGAGEHCRPTSEHGSH